jgi:phosphatidylinositol glycan anchor class Y biosynthesis protein
VSVCALLSFRGIDHYNIISVTGHKELHDATWTTENALNETLRTSGVLRMKFWGGLLVIVGCVSFVGFVFVAIVSKLFPLSDNPIIQAIQNDRYYCFLAPLTLPALLVAVYFHWLSMKLFKHA